MAGRMTLGRKLLLIVVIGFLLREAGMFAFGTYKFRDFADRYDFGFETGAIARSIALGHGFSSPFRAQTGPTAWIAPVYPYLVAGAFKVFGLYSDSSGIFLLSLNALASALTVWPIFLIARRLFTLRMALISAWTWALAPPAMVWAISWIWDTAFSALLLTFLLFLSIKMAERSSTRRWLLFGALWGLAALMNPTLLSMLPFAGLYPLWTNRKRPRQPLFGAILAGIVFFAIISPWLVRNYRVFGRPVFIRSNFWAEMRYGNSPFAKGTWMGWTTPGVNPAEDRKYQQLGEMRYIELKKQEFLRFVHDYREYFVELCARRVLFFWYGFSGWREDLWTSFKNLSALAFSVIAIIGAGLMVKRRVPGTFLLVMTMAFYPVPYYLTYAYARYKHPMEPVMLLCAVYCLAQVRELRFLAGAGDPANNEALPATNEA